jgi:hypothetical protein
LAVDGQQRDRAHQGIDHGVGWLRELVLDDGRAEDDEKQGVLEDQGIARRLRKDGPRQKVRDEPERDNCAKQDRDAGPRLYVTFRAPSDRICHSGLR